MGSGKAKSMTSNLRRRVPLNLQLSGCAYLVYLFQVQRTTPTEGLGLRPVLGPSHLLKDAITSNIGILTLTTGLKTPTYLGVYIRREQMKRKFQTSVLRPGD